MFKKAKGAKPALQFSLRDASPDYDTLAEKCAELRAAISKLDAEETDLLGKLATRTPKPQNGMNSRVAAMLDEVVDLEDPLLDGLHARLREVNAVRRDTRAALAIATERLQRARVAASKVICAGIRDEYVARVSNLADSLIAAHQANAAVYELTNALSAADVTWTGMLPPAPARMLGATYDRANKVAMWLREAAADGLIDKSIIPSELTA